MNTQKIGKDADQNALPGAATAIASKRKRGATSAKSGNKGTKSKQDQLVALLSKPNGVRVSGDLGTAGMAGPYGAGCDLRSAQTWT
jgi:hypothetical protein